MLAAGLLAGCGDQAPPAATPTIASSVETPAVTAEETETPDPSRGDTTEGEEATPEGGEAGAPTSQPGGETSQPGTLVADIGFRPEVNGFKFENYTNDPPRTNLTPQEVQRMFGD